MLSDGFDAGGRGFNGPLLVVVDLNAPGVNAAGVPALLEGINAIRRIVAGQDGQAS